MPKLLQIGERSIAGNIVMFFRRQWISSRLGRLSRERGMTENGKKRKSTGDEGSSDVKLPCISVEDDSGIVKRTSKKKGFSWNQYFSEEIGIAAPPRLFKNVIEVVVGCFWQSRFRFVISDLTAIACRI